MIFLRQIPILIIGLALVGLFFSSCDKDDPIIPNEEEVITTLLYTLTPEGGGDPVELSFRDLDGDGGDAPIIVGGSLSANTTYTGTLQLLNEQNDPAENITAEIQTEDADHQFFFQTTVSGLSVAYEDQDDNGNPLGLATTATTQDAAVGLLTITLRHEPDKTAQGVSEGNIINAGGETDLEVTFNVNVQ